MGWRGEPLGARPPRNGLDPRVSFAPEDDEVQCLCQSRTAQTTTYFSRDPSRNPDPPPRPGPGWVDAPMWKSPDTWVR